MSEKIIVFAAHPDDETLGCGGTIAKRLSEGYIVIVVIMTDGRHALSLQFGITCTPTPEEMKQIRRNETISAMKILGVPSENILFWDFEDGKLAEYSKEATTKVDRILNEVQPVEIYFPYEKDNHRDHRAAGLVVEECIMKLNFPTRAYQYLLEHKFANIGPVIGKLHNSFRSDLFLVDVSRFIQQKAAAINEYKSQTGVMFTGQERPVLENTTKFLKKQELFFKLNDVPLQ